MFKLQPNPTFTAPVPLSVPGLPQPVEVQITFRHKNRSALRAWMVSAENKSDVVVLDEVIHSWSGLFDAVGEPVPYSITALTDVVENYPVAHLEIQRAYIAELTEAKKKI